VAVVVLGGGTRNESMHKISMSYKKRGGN
jgi:hypothetical protein